MRTHTQHGAMGCVCVSRSVVRLVLPVPARIATLKVGARQKESRILVWATAQTRQTNGVHCLP